MPFFHSDQMTLLRTPMRDMVGNHADMSVIQAFGAVDLRYDGANWQIRNQSATGAQWADLADQSFYIPEFRVVAMSVGLASPSGSPASFYHVMYDLPHPNPRLFPQDAAATPASHGNGDWFPTGQKCPVWVTRLRLNADTTATKITLWR